MGYGTQDAALVAALGETGVWTEGEGSDLFVIFSGLPGNFGQPIFEFRKTMGAIAGRKVFLRDLRQLWWTCGISDAVPTLSDLIALLSVDVSSADRVITLGSSAGGYGALLFGTLLDADLALAFSPQTFMNRSTRLACVEKRWGYSIKSLYDSTADVGLLNLREVIKPRRAIVWARAECPQDKHHVDNIADLPNVEARIVSGGEPDGCTGPGCLYPCNGHDTAMALKKEGGLLSAIQGAVSDLG